VGNFRSIDVHASRRFVLPRSELDVFLEVINLFDFQNPCCAAYDVVTTPLGSTELEIDLDDYLPLVPSIGVAWRF